MGAIFNGAIAYSSRFLASISEGFGLLFFYFGLVVLAAFLALFGVFFAITKPRETKRRLRLAMAFLER